MCGITGLYLLNGENIQAHKKQVAKSLSELKNRGPDNSNLHFFDKVGFGHSRLKIIDTSDNANQPFFDVSRRYSIIFNGEIYNYKEIRKKLNGYNFQTNSDTEVLLYALIHYGLDCLEMLNGFFAFAFYDTKNDEMYIARDRLGIKPLYYQKNDERLSFASEFKSLIHYGINFKIDENSLWQYLQFNYIPAPNTAVQNVNKLMPGHYIRIIKGDIEFGCYFNLSKQRLKINTLDDKSIKTNLKDLVRSSVKKRLVSDVPLGTFLSGGIDSSIITSIASEYKSDLKTFSIGFKDDSYFNETKYAEMVAKRLRTEHTSIMMTKKDLISSMYSILDYIDEPFSDSSSIPLFHLCKRTRKHIKVALSGDGADELFSGYEKHRAEYFIQNSGFLKRNLLNIGYFSKFFPKSREGDLYNLIRKIDKLWNGSKLSTKERYWNWASFNAQDSARSLIAKEFNEADYFSRKSILLNDLDSSFNSVLITDQKLVLLNDMLTKVDLTSMANSLEVRVPFLDHNLVNYVNSINSKYKINFKSRKLILKQVFSSYLPDDIANRPKHGFEAPLRSLLLNEFNDKLEKYFSKDMIKEQSIFDYSKVEKMIFNLRSNNSEDSAYHVWNMIVFQKWYQKFSQLA